MKKNLSLIILFGILCFSVHAQTTYNLDGTWIGDGLAGDENSYMYVFDEYIFMILILRNDTYENLCIGYFILEKAQFVIDTYEYTQCATHIWRNDSWEEGDFLEANWYITVETNNRFSIRDHVFTRSASWANTFTKQ
jgi:hypothetical protein